MKSLKSLILLGLLSCIQPALAQEKNNDCDTIFATKFVSWSTDIYVLKKEDKKRFYQVRLKQLKALLQLIQNSNLESCSSNMQQQVEKLEHITQQYTQATARVVEFAQKVNKNKLKDSTDQSLKSEFKKITQPITELSRDFGDNRSAMLITSKNLVGWN